MGSRFRPVKLAFPLVGGACLSALLFLSAGRLDLPMFWAVIALFVSAGIVGGVLADPSLLKERMHPGEGGEDYFTARVGRPLLAIALVLAGLDVGRFHWSDVVPSLVQYGALAGYAAGVSLGIWAIAVNRFFSSVVRLQTDRGHHLVTAGPYRFVRHPGYAGAMLMLPCIGLALGSVLAAAVAITAMPLMLRRLLIEDRFLRANLSGYLEYAARVRYRLIPGIW